MDRAQQLCERLNSDLNRPGSQFELWWGRLDAPDPYDETDIAARLSPLEKARAQRLKIPEKRQEFMLARLRVRQLVSECCFLPDRTEIGFNAAGKPELRGATDAQISWSRSGPWLALIISAAAPVGIDIERVGALNMAPMIDMICSPSEAAQLDILQGSQKQECFFRLWTLKEAILKSVGTGFQANAKDISLPLSVFQQDTKMPSRCDAFGREFSLLHWSQSNARMALAVERQSAG